MKYRVCDLIVDRLRDFGVGRFFSVSGANIEPIHDSIALRGRGLLSSVLARHESGAAFMADAHARVHNVLGLCGSTSGGGMLNLLAGIAEAQVESVPLLALIGQPPTGLWGTGAFQDSSGIGRTVDARILFGAVSKHCERVDVPEAAEYALARAVQAALGGRSGASVLLLPRDILLAEVPELPGALADPRVAPAQIDDAEFEQFASCLAAAGRPVLLLGHGVLRSPEPEAVATWARLHGVPVTVTLSGKGAFPNADSLFCGVVGASGDEAAVAALDTADLVVVVGAGLNLMTRMALGERLASLPLAFVNVEDDYVDRVVRPLVKVHGDAGRTFRRLLDRGIAAGGSPVTSPPSRSAAGLAPRTLDLDRATAPLERTPASLTMVEAVELLRRRLPAGNRLVVDAGNAGATACHLLPCPTGGSFVTALGMGGMGWAVAAAVGACLPPARGPSPTPTVVVAGDGAALMNGAEISTMAQLGLPILLLILNNASHGMCITRQALFFGGRFEAVDYPEVDFEQVARGLAGSRPLDAVRATNRGELASALDRFLPVCRPAVIDVPVIKEELPPFRPFLDAATRLQGVV